MPDTNTKSDLEILRQLNADFVASAQSGDVRRLEQILAEDFMTSLPDFLLRDKKQFLDMVAALSGEGWFDGYGLLQLFRRRAMQAGARYVTDEAVVDSSFGSGALLSIRLRWLPGFRRYAKSAL